MLGDPALEWGPGNPPALSDSARSRTDPVQRRSTISAADRHRQSGSIPQQKGWFQDL